MNTPNINLIIHFIPSKSRIENNSTLQVKFEEQRKFYGCESGNNYLRYVEKGSKEKLDYVNYSGNKEKSEGVFNQDGLMDNQEKTTYRKLFSETDSPIWHGVISFEEMFGKTYVNDFEQAYNLLIRQLPKFFKQAGFKQDNIVWFAGLHSNTDNRHIHFSFIEKEPLSVTRSDAKNKRFHNGKIGLFAMNKFKIDMERMIINNSLFKERNKLLDTTKETLSNYELDKKLYDKLIQIKDYLPTEGRISYESQNLKLVQKAIDNAVVQIIKMNKGLKTEYENFLNSLAIKESELKEVCKRNKLNFEYFSLEKKYIADINKRLGNLVLNTLKLVDFKEGNSNYLKNNRLVAKRIKRNKRKKLARHASFLKSKVENEAMKYFKELLQKLDKFDMEEYLNNEEYEL